jgi:hypothetical protein
MKLREETLVEKQSGSVALKHKRQLSLNIKPRSIVTSCSNGKLLITVWSAV